MDILSQICGYCSILFCLFFSFADFVAAVVSTNETVAVGNLVSLACAVGALDHTVWAVKRNESPPKALSLSDQIFDNKNMELTIASISDSGSFSYNLLILNASQDMEGYYNCVEGGVTKSTVFLSVEVPPIVTLKVDNRSHDINNGTASINVKLDQDITIQCVAEGGKPLVSLGWEINGNPEIHGIAVNETFHAVISTLHYRPKEGDTVISCTTSGQIAIPDIRRQTSLNIVYKPRCISQFINDFFTCHCTSNPAANVTILINGSHNVYSQTVTLNFQYPVNLSCLAINSIGKTTTEAELFLPNVNHSIPDKPRCISQIINDFFTCHCTSNPAANVIILINGSHNVYSQTVTLNFHYPVNLSCLAINSIGKTTTEAELFLPNVNHSIPDVYDSTTVLPKQLTSLYTIGIPICSMGFLLACFLVFTYMFLWRKVSRNLRRNQSVISSHPMKVLDKGPSDIDQSINQKGGRREELPEIPVDEDNSQNSHHSEGNEPNYYSTADAIAEKLIRKKNIHWEAFIRKCLELPASNHLAKIEAISIQSSKLFLISEHLNCENLHSVLSRDTKDKGDYYCCSSLSVPDVIKHVAGVLEGMDVLKTFGFLHPGLTTKKVLLTKEGQVKLFDFCLAGDAPKIAALKKAQVPTVTLNQFPPEMLLLNHYTETSDVWSTAVVIWEIMAAGNPPFPVNKEVTSVSGEATTPSAPWPEKYLQIKDKILFDCWNHNSSLRPSIHHLRGTFVAIFEKLIADSFYEIPIPTTYLPMRAPDTAQPSYAEHIYHAAM
ncbi:uncharacterized protein [Apostichopus japonicus]|uniref:uncharacterized protein isoform X3 n=1 Tax=Stichopus japonicus TaxID=307972 RepID=UPI003AB21103